MKRFEADIVMWDPGTDIEGRSLKDKLNELGKEGWTIVASHLVDPGRLQMESGKIGRIMFVLQREVDARVSPEFLGSS